jgi:hypothetical protein
MEASMLILAVDPGFLESAFVFFDTASGQPTYWEKIRNEQLLGIVRSTVYDALAIEEIQNFGMAAGRELFDTVFWSGRFCEAADIRNIASARLGRKQVVGALCRNGTANDANVRQALIGRWGGDSVAIGGKKCDGCGGNGWCGRGRPVCVECNGSTWKYPPGPLHGFTRDCWSALSIAVVYAETKGVKT